MPSPPNWRARGKRRRFEDDENDNY